MAKKKKDADVEPAEGGEAQEPKKKRGTLLPALVVAIAVLGAGAMAGGVIGGGGDAAMAGPAPTPTPTPIELGLVTELEAITLNLAGDQGHFLKLGIAIETSPDVAEIPPTAPIFDTVIAQFATYSYEDLSNLQLREQTKEDLLTSLETIYGTDIVRLYYTEFVMQ